MLSLLQQYARIALLMGKPQDLPAGNRQMQTGILLCLVTYIVAIANSEGVSKAVLTAIIDIGLTALLFYAWLSVVNQLPRFAQAFGGFCGASAFVNVVAMPIFISSGGTELSSTEAFAHFFLLVWSLSVLGRILRFTFETSIPVSIAAAFMFYLVLIAVMGTLVPSTASQSAWLAPATAWMV